MENILKNLCREYERELNSTQKGRHTVVFEDGKKTDGYWIKDKKNPIVISWYSEIFVNGVCIFRNGIIPTKDIEEDWVQAKRLCHQLLLTSIFFHGIAAARMLLSNQQATQN